MYQFVYDHPVKVLFGPGQLGELHKQNLPGKKALLATSNGTSVKRCGYLDSVQKELELAGVSYELFDEIRANPTAVNVMDGAARMRETGCDFILALGGGSVMDCAKCIALMAANSGDIWDYSSSEKGGGQTPEHPALPIVCITTSSGTASEVDRGAVISNDALQEKTLISHPSFLPAISVVDPNLTVSVPPVYTAYQGMDAFFHASETVLSKLCHPMAEMFALKSIELVSRYLPRAVRDGSDMEAREMMAYASSFAGYYMLCTSGHRIEHVVGSFHEDLPHGAGLIMTAHAYYDFLAEKKAAEDRMILMARAMGREQAASGKDFVEALDELIAAVGCADLKMSDWGITREGLALYPPKIHKVLGGNIAAEPIFISDEEYLTIYENACR